MVGLLVVVVGVGVRWDEVEGAWMGGRGSLEVSEVAIR